jgi:tetratricopeptide (TPR) repeat protein
MAKNSEIQDPKQLEKIESTLSKAELYIEKNQKKLTYIVGALVLLVGGIMVYKNLVQAPREKEAQSLIWQAENYFKVDSFQIALYGNESVMGFAEFVDEYGSTKSGNLAKGYAGFCSLKLGEYKEAIDYLEDYKTEDPIVGPLAKSGIGDAYSELKQYDKAVDYYMQAAELSNHELISPKFLMKAGLVYEKLGKKDKALEVYTQIKEKYDTSPEASMIDKYITRVSYK